MCARCGADSVSHSSRASAPVGRGTPTHQPPAKGLRQGLPAPCGCHHPCHAPHAGRLQPPVIRVGLESATGVRRPMGRRTRKGREPLCRSPLPSPVWRTEFPLAPGRRRGRCHHRDRLRGGGPGSSRSMTVPVTLQLLVGAGLTAVLVVVGVPPQPYGQAQQAAVQGGGVAGGAG